MAAAVQPDGKSLLLTVSSDSTVRLWGCRARPALGLILARNKPPARARPLRPNGKSILSATWERRGDARSASTSLAIWPKIHQPGEVTTVAFQLPDGETLLHERQYGAAMGCGDWPRRRPETLRHRGPVNLVAYSRSWQVDHDQQRGRRCTQYSLPGRRDWRRRSAIPIPVPGRSRRRGLRPRREVSLHVRLRNWHCAVVGRRVLDVPRSRPFPAPRGGRCCRGVRAPMARPFLTRLRRRRARSGTWQP